ncbi:HAD family hydrolase [Anaerocolumna xylanovorans]|uniref:Phosphoglycolate phosphatase n=1 Tax=Anaerocolumna xylanovorans DSM 12503 TaxID=1121345 RepID=A0A1M7Y558_9FIRM|nr:HAD family hydrolase [Anaerocolumna xylanovorans]SHO47535.1 phosphoglycolate phosphatase [Anaerocolumna xylanovorans DSM 12503]
MSNMIKGILFDKDGTLIEFREYWHMVISRLFELLEREYGVSTKTLGVLKERSGYLPEGFQKESIIQYATTSQIIDIWEEIIKQEEGSSLGKEKLFFLFEEIALTKNIAVRSLPGVDRLIPYLKEKGYLLGIATADSRRSAVHSLKKTGLLGYFDYIGCNEENTEAKPSPQMVYSFCRQTDLKPEEVLVVGDSVTDMEFAENAGTSFAGLLTEYNDRARMEALAAITVVAIDEIIEKYHL